MREWKEIENYAQTDGCDVSHSERFRWDFRFVAMSSLLDMAEAKRRAEVVIDILDGKPGVWVTPEMVDEIQANIDGDEMWANHEGRNFDGSAAFANALRARMEAQ